MMENNSGDNKEFQNFLQLKKTELIMNGLTGNKKWIFPITSHEFDLVTQNMYKLTGRDLTVESELMEDPELLQFAELDDYFVTKRLGFVLVFTKKFSNL